VQPGEFSAKFWVKNPAISSCDGKAAVMPSVDAAHRWLINDVSMSGFCVRGMILPLA